MVGTGALVPVYISMHRPLSEAIRLISQRKELIYTINSVNIYNLDFNQKNKKNSRLKKNFKNRMSSGGHDL